MSVDVSAAARHQSRSTSASASPVNVTGAVQVVGMFFRNANAAAATVTIENAATSEVIAVIDLAGSGSVPDNEFQWTLPFKRTDGMDITASVVNVEATLFYNTEA